MCYFIKFCDARQVISECEMYLQLQYMGWTIPPLNAPMGCYHFRHQMASSAPFGLHSGYKNATLRLWQSCGTEVSPHNLMLPLFITDESPDAK